MSAPGEVTTSLPVERQVALRDIRGAVFRGNPEYELVLFDRLPPDQRDALQDLKKDPAFYGVLVPRNGNSGGIKAVCRNTALLYLTLNAAGALPSYVVTDFGENCNRAIAELVLDGVLQIEQQRQFVCGSEAYGLIYMSDGNAVAPGGALARLSQQALKYGQALDIDESARLSARLYFYNRIPLSERWRRRLPSEDAVLAYLGVARHRKLLDRRWSRMQLSIPFNGWLQWQARETPAAENNARQGYKLYLSPQPDRVPAAFEALVDSLNRSTAHHFKVGSDAAGLLRPDKLVAYFWSFDALQETAQRIAERMRGCPAQGVPFTATVNSVENDDGLLSWGIDPPPEKGALAWMERESWRLWITNRLATALVSAKKAATHSIEPWQYALERLRLENIDTDTWVPASSFGKVQGQ